MTLGSNQPYLLPYLGYWQLINTVDFFVISDNMQFIRHGFINRNYILFDGERHVFTLEMHGAHHDTPINRVEVGLNKKKILKTIFHAYHRAPYFENIYPLIESIFAYDEKNLAKFVGNSIVEIAKYFNMNTQFAYLGEVQGETDLKAQERTIDICTRLNTDHYINAIGGQELYDKGSFERAGITLNFLKSEPVAYQQFDNDFVPNLSIIDVMMFNSKDVIKDMLKSFKLI